VCDESKKKVISKVDTAFLKKWIATRKITGQIRKQTACCKNEAAQLLSVTLRSALIYDPRFTIADTSIPRSL
jgi:hypothetical protein